MRSVDIRRKLVFMGTTETLERRCELGWLEQARKLPGITESELVDRALMFANSRSVESYINFTAQLTRAHQDHGTPASEGIEQTRQRFRAALKAIVEGALLSKARLQEWQQMADGILPVETPASGSGKFHYLQIKWFAGADPDGLCALVLTWLVDPSRPYFGELCQCQWRECRKFFFAVPAKKQGKPRRRYCPAPRDPKLDHMTLEANKIRAAKMSRERKKARKGK